MFHSSQAKSTEAVTDEKILALSWNIATEPKLYRQLAPNPYFPRALQTISERFPNVSTADVVIAVIFAEPEGRYDRNFEYLEAVGQEEELSRQEKITSEINKRIDYYFNKYISELNQLPKDYAYDVLSKVAFGTTDLEEIQQKYSQNQRRTFKLSIVNFIEDTQKHDDSSFVAGPSEKKPSLARALLKIGFAVLSLVLFFYIAQRQIQIITQHPQAKKQVLATEAQTENQVFPVRLKIPSINVDAAIQYVGLTSKGAMDVPGNTIEVGWYKLGPSPGEKGSAVISGHFDGRIGEFGVFNNLDKLKQGDKIYVVNDLGTTINFVVRESRIYNPGYAEEVFLPNDNGTHLNLITCDGVWDGAKKSYNKRLVVFADIVN